MTRANDQAYPTPAGDHGLTIREHFAAMAMQGCLSLPSEHRSPDVIAKEAVMMANALIAALEK